MDWQPIETIPAEDNIDDSERVLLWVPNDGDSGKGAFVPGRAYRRFDGSIRALAEGYPNGWKITHWMRIDIPSEADR